METHKRYLGHLWATGRLLFGPMRALVFVSLFWIGITTSAYGTDTFAIQFRTNPDQFLTFDTSSPTSQTIINSDFSSPLVVFALDFDASASILYGADNSRVLGIIDTATGVFAPQVAITGVLTNHNIVGLSVDPTTDITYLYTVHGFGGSTPGALYTLDTTTGVASLIGQQGTAAQIADIAIDGAGRMFGVDLLTDSLYRIDTTTGAATLVGPLGFDIIGPQGMDFDFSDGTLYAVLSNRDSSQSIFARIDTETGAPTPLADFGDSMMVMAVASPAQPEPRPDIKANGADGPVSLSPGANLSITVALDADGTTAQADWWVAAITPFGFFYLDVTAGGWKPGLGVTLQAPLFDFGPLALLSTSGLPPGGYIFVFAVDLTMNGSFDQPLFVDVVAVTIQ